VEEEEKDDLSQGTHGPEDDLPPASPPQKTSEIPWERWRELGAFSAYWLTVFRLIFRDVRLTREIDTTINLPNARRFRRKTAWYAAWGIAIASALQVLSSRGERLLVDVKENAVLVLGTGAFALILKVCIMYALTDATSCFFLSRRSKDDRQDRALALGYYASAPLGLLVAAPLLMLLSAGFLSAVLLPRSVAILATVTGVLGTLVWLGYWILAVTAVRAVAVRPALRATMTGIALPLVWFVLGCFISATIGSIAIWVLMFVSIG